MRKRCVKLVLDIEDAQEMYANAVEADPDEEVTATFRMEAAAVKEELLRIWGQERLDPDN